MKRARPGNGALAAIDADYALFAGGMAPTAQAVSAVGSAVRAVHNAMRPWAARQMYLNLADTAPRPSQLLDSGRPTTGSAASRPRSTPAT